MVVLHPISGDGDHSELLRLLVDTKLTMQAAIDDTMSRVHPGVTAMLRTWAHCGPKDLLTHFRAHIWDVMQAHSEGIHACISHLERLDSCQRHFVEELGLTEATAFAEHSFAPSVLAYEVWSISGSSASATQTVSRFYHGLRTTLAIQQQLVAAKSCTTTL